VTTRPGAGRETELEHERLQLLLGGFVLGGLDVDDHQAFTRHLRHCVACQRESAQLSGLPALLDVVDRDRVTGLEPSEGMPGGPGTPEGSGVDGAAPAATLVPLGLLDRMRADRRRRRWRYGLAAAVLMLVAGAIGAGVGPVLDRLNAPPTRPLVASALAGGTGPAAAVEIDLVTRTWGTQLDVRGSSLPSGQVLYLSVTDRQGHAYDVASWTGTPTGRATLTAACWMKTADIAQVQVHTRSGTTIATATA
jgi:hypothetical protein